MKKRVYWGDTAIVCAEQRARRKAALIVAGVSLVLLACTVSQLAAAAPPLQTPITAGAHPQWIRVSSQGNASEKSRTPRNQQSEPAIGPYDAAQRARQQYGGRVLNVVLEHGPSGPYYQVKLLDRGRVRVVHINAAK
ncbi:MAG: PepSY domain-containing protein [Salinisphaera sp.]|jgi:hypothetical protein|nr:PepSY domain-containing protein [Salinisphaera sp.]